MPAAFSPTASCTCYTASFSGILSLQLQQVPKIPVQVSENSNCAVRLAFWFPHERNPERNHVVVISPEVVGIEKQKDSATSLVANEWFLLRLRGSREYQARTVGSWGCDHHPTFVLFRLVSILDQREVQFLRIKLNGLIVVANDERYMNDGLLHIRKRSLPPSKLWVNWLAVTTTRRDSRRLTTSPLATCLRHRKWPHVHKGEPPPRRPISPFDESSFTNRPSTFVLTASILPSILSIVVSNTARFVTIQGAVQLEAIGVPSGE